MKGFLYGGVFLALSMVFAQEEPIEINSFTSTQDCGELKYEVQLDPNDSTVQCLRVYFNDFALVSDGMQNIQRNCHMNAKLRIPPNTRFRATEAIAEGVYKMEEANGGITLSYALSSLKAVGTWFEHFQANSNGNFNFAAKINSTDLTPCLAYETEVELSSDIHAFIEQYSTGSSYVGLDESGKRLSWNWKIEKCEPDLFARTFVSYYGGPTGRKYEAIIKISGDKGTYSSNEGFVGQLYDLKRSEGGFLLEGKWQARMDVKGDFKFRIINPQTGRFDGYWQDDQGRQGYWWGEYSQE